LTAEVLGLGSRINSQACYASTKANSSEEELSNGTSVPFLQYIFAISRRLIVKVKRVILQILETYITIEVSSAQRGSEIAKHLQLEVV
jgi:hypothetical protein